MRYLLCCLIALNLACSKRPIENLLPSAASPNGKTLSYLALGDSYTVGESVSQAESFPYQLMSALSKQGIRVSDIKIIAKTGWTTDELKSAIKSQNLTQQFDLVTLLIGVNNQFRGYSAEVYRTEFKELLATAISSVNGDKAKVFVLSIPDWGATPYASGRDRSAIGREIDLFNLINKEEALHAGVSYTDITPESRKAITDPSLVAVDGLHPSGKMYAYWASQLLPKVSANLN